MTDHDDTIIDLHSYAANPPPKGLSYALHVVQALRPGSDGSFPREWVTVYQTMSSIATTLERWTFMTATDGLVREGMSLACDRLEDGSLAKYHGTTDGQARAWLRTVIRSKVVDLLRQERIRTVRFNPNKHDFLMAPTTAQPGYDPADDPEGEFDSLADARRAIEHLPALEAEIRRAHPGGAEGPIEGMTLWLESSRNVRNLVDQVQQVFGDEAHQAPASRLMKMRDVVYKKRSRGRMEAMAAIARLASADKLDDLAVGSLYRLFRVSLADREKLKQTSLPLRFEEVW